MKTLIIYISAYHQNTEKIAQAMAEVLGIKIVRLSEIKPKEIQNYDLIGFGSGIYFWRHHRGLLNFVKNLAPVQNRKAFIFSTSGVKFAKKLLHYSLRKILINKGFKIISEFNCLGWDTMGPFKLFGGFNKGRPNEADLRAAKKFAQDLVKIYKVKFVDIKK